MTRPDNAGRPSRLGTTRWPYPHFTAPYENDARHDLATLVDRCTASRWLNKSAYRGTEGND